MSFPNLVEFCSYWSIFLYIWIIFLKHNFETIFIQRAQRIKTIPAHCHGSCGATDRKIPSLIILLSSYGKKICPQFLSLNQTNQSVLMPEGPGTQGCFVYEFNKRHVFLLKSSMSEVGIRELRKSERWLH